MLTTIQRGSPNMLQSLTRALAFIVRNHGLNDVLFFPLLEPSSDQCNEDLLEGGLLSPGRHDLEALLLDSIFSCPCGSVCLDHNLHSREPSFFLRRRSEPLYPCDSAQHLKPAL